MPEIPLRRIEQRAHLRCRGYVCLDGLCPASCRVDLANQALRIVRWPGMVDDHGHAAPGEPRCDRTPDPARRTGHVGDTFTVSHFRLQEVQRLGMSGITEPIGVRLRFHSSKIDIVYAHPSMPLMFTGR